MALSEASWLQKAYTQLQLLLDLSFSSLKGIL